MNCSGSNNTAPVVGGWVAQAHNSIVHNDKVRLRGSGSGSKGSVEDIDSADSKESQGFHFSMGVTLHRHSLGTVWVSSIPALALPAR